MSFQFYSNVISQASRRIAGGIFVTGLMLIGFGLLIYLYPKFFATLAAMVFFVAGLGTCTTALKIFAAQHRMNKNINNESDGYRKNVRIHTEEQDTLM
jgi:Kef-type K+ transport system membrane component KefB